MITTTPTHPSRPLIAFVGRPNVGKSTLFNRLIGARQSVVSSTRGTTRDRLYGAVRWRSRTITLMDLGGIELTESAGLTRAVQRHVQRAVDDADGFVLICDAHEGLLPADELIAARLRTAGKPLLVVVNKVDQPGGVPAEFFTLNGLPLFAVSALHGTGTGDLLDALITHFRIPMPSGPALPPSSGTFAIIGRQNVGKSSLLNALLREERALVTDEPGTTRDLVEAPLTVAGERLTLIDTAGLRHRRKVRNPIDTFSMSRTLEALARCDIALVVLDATQGVTSDDRRLVDLACKHQRGLLILLNKWDLIAQRPTALQLVQRVHRTLPASRFAPVLPISATTGFQVTKALASARAILHTMRRGLSESACTSLLRSLWDAAQTPRVRGRLIHLEGARWTAGRPTKLELMLRPMSWLPPAHYRGLLNRLYAARPGLAGVPIQLITTQAGGRRRG